MALSSTVRIRVVTQPKVRLRMTPALIPADGEDGIAATVAVGTVETLPPGSPATVENVGTENAAVLNFGIPQGGQGTPGLLQSVVAGANVTVDATDPANPVVSATGGGSPDAVLTTDTDASGFGFVIDEDNMASNSATKVPTQQSVVAYAKSRTFINVKADFDAAGDGVTDDTAKIQAAMDAAAAAGGGSVFIPPLTFVTTDALIMPSNVWLRGDGEASVIKSDVLAGAPSPQGHRHIEADGKSHFRITDLVLDASGMTSWSAGMKSILCHDSSNYRIARVHFKTNGAAVASVGCSEFSIEKNRIDVSSTDGAHKHDGVIDQWGGCHDFKVLDNVINGGGIARYGILVTGEDTDGSATANYNFEVASNRVFNSLFVGIWLNGREGANADFTVHDNIVLGVSDYYGIAISDGVRFACHDNIVRQIELNGLRFYAETGAGGTLGAGQATIHGNIISGANQAGNTGDEGAAIFAQNPSQSLAISCNRVGGSTHSYAVSLSASTTGIIVAADNSLAAGTQGTIRDLGSGNRVLNPHLQGTYTPTVSSPSNITSSIVHALRYERLGAIVKVDGLIQITPTAVAQAAFELTLPVASNLTSAIELTGAGAIAGQSVPVAITGNVTTDRAQFTCTPASSGSVLTLCFSYSYKVN